MKTLFCTNTSLYVFWNLYTRPDIPPYANGHSDNYEGWIRFESDIDAERYSTISNIMFREIYTELCTDKRLLVFK
jgi:hypothetical protein